MEPTNTQSAKAKEQQHYGAAYFIEKNSDKDLTVFIIDDNEPYLNLLKKLVERPNFSVFTFTTGEEALEYIQLKPDLVILDYHLDGTNPYAMKGDRIAEIIEQRVPGVEIVLISSDNKFNLISELHLSQAQNIIYKDENAIIKIKSMSDRMAGNVQKVRSSYRVPFFIVLAVLVIENVLLMILI